MRCHTTGFGKVGGFVSTAETPDTVGVSCEAATDPAAAREALVQSEKLAAIGGLAAGVVARVRLPELEGSVAALGAGAEAAQLGPEVLAADPQ